MDARCRRVRMESRPDRWLTASPPTWGSACEPERRIELLTYALRADSAAAMTGGRCTATKFGGLVDSYRCSHGTVVRVANADYLRTGPSFTAWPRPPALPSHHLALCSPMTTVR
jgi:hypothetical protein